MGLNMTKAKVENWCNQNQVALSIHKWTNGVIHVHADIDKPQSIFRSHQLHGIALHDDVTRPDWKSIYKELIDADLGPCLDSNCEYCKGD